MGIQEQLQQLIEVCHSAHDKGLVRASGGNASIRSGNDIYITPSGYSLRRIKVDDIVKVSIEGKISGSIKPSKELALHLSAYRSRPDVTTILHVHSFYTIIAGILAENFTAPLPPYTPGYVMKVGNPAMVGYFCPGSAELAQSIETALQSNSVVLMKNHGVVLVGNDMSTLLDKAEELESNASIHIHLKGFGSLGSNAVAEIKAKYH